MTEKYKRQGGMVSRQSIEQMPDIVLVGAGGIGSTTAIALAKMGCSRIHIVDFDSIEEHNIPNQMHPDTSIGQSKVESMASVMKMFNKDCEIFEVKSRFEFNTLKDIVSPIIIMGVDSMKSRKEIYNYCKHKACFIIDGRMGGWLYTVYAYESKDFKKYEETLHSDEESEPIPCSERAIIFNTLSIGGEIAKTLAKWASDKPFSNHVTRDLLNDVLVV